MSKDEILRDYFTIPVKDTVLQLKNYSKVEHISDKMKYFHGIHESECCACQHKLCVYDELNNSDDDEN